jgi:hypothetical protein
MNNFEQYKMAFYEREIVKKGDRIKSLLESNEMLTKDNERLKEENLRAKEQLEVLELKNKGFVGRGRRINCIGIICDNDKYEKQMDLN